MSDPRTICFVGSGNMARSLIGGLLENGHDPARVTASDPLEKATKALAEEFGIRTFADNAQATEAAEVIVLAVKPQQMQTVVSELGKNLKGKLVVSIAAGVQCKSMESWAGETFDLVRCMPNTPALLQCGATALYASAEVSKDNRDTAATILASAGEIAWVDSESELDAITALSGSGPAYFFLLIESMTNAAIKQGLPKELANTFAIQTALGAARMAHAGEHDPAQLRKNVTSPGGTTEAALNSFGSDGFAEIVERAMQAAHDRSEQLGKVSD
jgi:pyrroline-5-carboxylate reductase